MKYTTSLIREIKIKHKEKSLLPSISAQIKKINSILCWQVCGGKQDISYKPVGTAKWSPWRWIWEYITELDAFTLWPSNPIGTPHHTDVPETLWEVAQCITVADCKSKLGAHLQRAALMHHRTPSEWGSAQWKKERKMLYDCYGDIPRGILLSKNNQNGIITSWVELCPLKIHML